MRFVCVLKEIVKGLRGISAYLNSPQEFGNRPLGPANLFMLCFQQDRKRA